MNRRFQGYTVEDGRLVKDGGPFTEAAFVEMNGEGSESDLPKKLGEKRVMNEPFGPIWIAERIPVLRARRANGKKSAARARKPR